MEDGPYISTLLGTGPLQPLPQHILDRIKRSARDPHYFNAVTFEALADQYLEECYHNFVRKSEDKELHEVYDCWEKQYYILRREYEDFLSTYDPSKWKPSRIRSFMSQRKKIFKPEMERIKETIKEYVCWRQWRRRYPALLEKAEQGDLEAKEKLDAVFTKKGHLRLHIHRQLGKEYVRSWNEDIQWWLLERRDQIPRWKLSQVISEMANMGFVPKNSRQTGKLGKEEEYHGHDYDKFIDRARKMLNEMKIPTREGKRGRPRNH